MRSSALLLLLAAALVLLASIAAGLIWDREGPSAVFIAGAAVAAVAWAMLSLLPKESATFPRPPLSE